MEIYKGFKAKGEPEYYINRFYYTKLFKWLKLLNHLQEVFSIQAFKSSACVFSFLLDKSKQKYRHMFNCMKLAAEE